MKKKCDVKIKITNGKIRIDINDYYIELKENSANKKAAIVIVKNLKPVTKDKRSITYEEISIGLGHKDRQWSNNSCRKYNESENMLEYLTWEKKIDENSIKLIENHILDNLFLNIDASYKLFISKNPNCKIGKTAFNYSISKINSANILKKLKEVVKTDESIDINWQYYINELLEAEPQRKKEIKELVKQEEVIKKEKEIKKSVSIKDSEKYLLVTLLYSCGLAMNMIGVLFGVTKATIHNWVYRICTKELENMIISKIECFSGKICVDEKWVKVNGIWNYIISAVDAATGFPLLIKVFPAIDTNAWATFFKLFKNIYGIPKLIISDGSLSLAAGKEIIFPNVCHQLCIFHKFRNLLKKIYQYADKSDLKRYLKLAKGIFKNSNTSARKKAAITLISISGGKIKEYVEKKLIASWSKITKCLTSNASERFNRKLEKVIVVRYGIKTIESLEVIIRSLWLRELMLNGKKHIKTCDEINSISIPKICQENLNFSHILQFLKSEKGFYIDAA